MTTMFAQLTSLLLVALAVVVGLMLKGVIATNFALMLLVLTLITGLYWLGERFYFRPQRFRAAAALDAQQRQRRAQLAQQGIDKVDGDIDEARQKLLSQPWWLDWTAGLFPVILVVFLLRSFLFEPFKIPSGSMIPTLLVGDLILVNKFHYGIRLPVINKKILSNHDPERGDVMVFRYPVDPSIDYIKRVVGLPGDEVAYLNKRLTINGKPVEETQQPDFYDDESLRYTQQWRETLGAAAHNILVNTERPPGVVPFEGFPFKQDCRYSAEGVVCKVPAGHYFMMGDNRDNSQDSRYWGFVPDENIVGRAFFVWMNFSDWKRIGSFH